MADGAANPAPGASDSLPARACKVNKPYRLFYHYNGKNSTYLFWIVDFEDGKGQEHRGVRAGKKAPLPDIFRQKEPFCQSDIKMSLQP